MKALYCYPQEQCLLVGRSVGSERSFRSMASSQLHHAQRVLIGKPFRSALLWLTLLFASVCFGQEGIAPSDLSAAGTATGMKAGTARTDGPELVVQNGHSEPVAVTAISPDGALLATGTGGESTVKQGEVKLWDLHTGRLLRTIALGPRNVRTLSFSSDATLLAIGAGPQSGVYSVETGEPQVRLGKVLTGYPVLLPASGAGAHQIAYVESEGLHVARADTGDDAFVIAASIESPAAIAVSPDGALVAVGQFGGSVQVFDLRQRRLAGTLKGEAASIHALAFRKDGEQLAVGGRDGRLELWSVSTLKRVATAPQLISYTVPISIYALQYTPDGRSLLGGTLNGVQVWDTGNTSLSPARTFAEQKDLLQGGANRIDAIALTPDGATVVLGGLAGIVQLWDRSSGRLLRDLSGRIAPLRQVCFVPSKGGEGAALPRAALLDDQGGLSLFDLTSARLGWSTTADPAEAGKRRVASRFGRALATTPDGTVLVAALGGRIVTYDTATGAVLGDLNRSVPVSNGGLGGVRMYERLTLSDAGKTVIALYTLALSSAEHLECFDRATGKTRWDVTLSNDGMLTDMVVRADGAQIAVVVCPPGEPGKAQITLRTATDGSVVSTLSNTQHCSGPLAWSPDGKRLAGGAFIIDSASARGTVSDYGVRIWDTVTGTAAQTLRMEKGAGEVRALTWIKGGAGILSGGKDGTIRLFQAQNGRLVTRIPTGAAYVVSLDVTPESNRVLVGYADGRAEDWNLVTGRRTILIATGPADYLLATDEGYYRATRGAREAVAFRRGRAAYPFDQFDLRYNRPDKILEALGSPDTRLADAFRAAYQKRLARMGVTPESLADPGALPTMIVDTSGLSPTTTAATLTLPVRAAANSAGVRVETLLDRILVSVNDVPVRFTASGDVKAGSEGLDLRARRTATYTGQITIPLGTAVGGRNRIDISVRDSRGVESLRQTIDIQRVATRGTGKTTPGPDLYVLAVGVSRYQDSQYSLQFADRDAVAVASLWKGGDTTTKSQVAQRYGKVHVLTLTNEQATRDAILTQGQRFLAPAGMDDIVVVFFAGHGLLDRKKDYFFATHNTDFANPATQGLAYDELEALLAGLEARQKLLLIDTCHAGEVDKESVVTAAPTGAGGTGASRSGNIAPGVRAIPIGVSGVAARKDGTGQRRGVAGDTATGPQVGLNDSFTLMQELFTDLRRSSGTVVISAAAGSEYAYERQGNGVFTASIMEALAGGKAPRDADGQVRVGSLRDYVTRRVRELTGGAQTPTARRENLAVDFPIY